MPLFLRILPIHAPDSHLFPDQPTTTRMRQIGLCFIRAIDDAVATHVDSGTVEFRCDVGRILVDGFALTNGVDVSPDILNQLQHVVVPEMHTVLIGLQASGC